MGVQREVEVGLGRRMRRELQVEPLILCLVQPAPAGTPFTRVVPIPNPMIDQHRAAVAVARVVVVKVAAAMAAVATGMLVAAARPPQRG